MNRNVLIVEDEQELAKVLKRYLEDSSCSVQLAFTGDSGLRTAQSKSFDLILLDIMLPGMAGIEICRRLRAQRVYTPILMLTAKSSEVDRVLGLVPLLFGSPVGKELEVPLAQVVLGGLFTATLLNMVVVPTVYNRVEQWREKRQAKVHLSVKPLETAA